MAVGQLDENLLQKMNAARGMFFWLGWHARGDTEDSDDMLRPREGVVANRRGTLSVGLILSNRLFGFSSAL